MICWGKGFGFLEGGWGRGKELFHLGAEKNKPMATFWVALKGLRSWHHQWRLGEGEASPHLSSIPFLPLFPFPFPSVLFHPLGICASKIDSLVLNFGGLDQYQTHFCSLFIALSPPFPLSPLLSSSPNPFPTPSLSPSLVSAPTEARSLPQLLLWLGLD